MGHAFVGFGALSVLVLLVLVSSAARSADYSGSVKPRFDLLNPEPGRFEFEMEYLSGFRGPGSIVRVRENQTEGTGLHFGSLGINTVQMPSVELTYWFNRVNAINFQFRYFDVGGSHFSGIPVRFNGSTIAPRQTLHSDPPAWFSLALYYERRLTPLYERQEARWPRALRGWDLRARIGLEYTYIHFSINGGHARVTPTSKGEETKEDFMHQELPIPTVGLEALHDLGGGFTLDAAVKGDWINRWNSLRNEGGTVWLSQNGVEGHARLLYSNPILGPIHPMAGFFYYYYSQLERSREDGNFMRWSAYGPELGLNVTF